MEQLEKPGTSQIVFTKDTSENAVSGENIQEEGGMSPEPKAAAHSQKEPEPKTAVHSQKEPKSGTAACLRRELEAEKAARLEAEKRAAALSQGKELLEKDLASVKKRLEEEKRKASEMQPFSDLSDSETEEGNGEFKFTSICQVFTDHLGKRCKRLADIKGGRVVPFSKTEGEPPYFANRDRLPLFAGPDEDAFVGVWDWSPHQNLKDARKDYIKMRYNDSARYIAVEELPDCHSCRDIAGYLAANLLTELGNGRVFFACKEVDGRVEGLLCTKGDFEFVQEESVSAGAWLKKEVCTLPRYTVDARDILELSKKKFYRYTNMGTPQSVFQVKSPLEVVKEVVLARAASARLRKEGLTKKEIQHVQAFLKGLPGETLCGEIAEVCGCTEQEAKEYFSAFVEQADSCLRENDPAPKKPDGAVESGGKTAEECQVCQSEEHRTEPAAVLPDSGEVLQKPALTFSFTRGERKFLPGGPIADGDAFEKALKGNLCLAGYEASAAGEMARRMAYALGMLVPADTTIPVVCGANGERIARCLSAMWGGKGACHLTLPGGEDRCREICDFIDRETAAEGRGVFLINGVFEGGGSRAFHEIQQRARERGTDAALLFSLNGMDRGTVPGHVWSQAVFLDGDMGLEGFEAETLKSYGPLSQCDRKYDEALFGRKKELLGGCRGLVDNRALLEYARYLAVTESGIEPGGMVLTQILLSAGALGKKRELLEFLLSGGFDIKADESITRYL